MKGKLSQAGTVLRPLLDGHPDSAVAVVGCTASGLARHSCELDVLVVGGERQPPQSIKLGDAFADIYFLADRDVLRPPGPEQALAIAGAKPVRDPSLVFSTASAASAAALSASAETASRSRLAAALKAVGRAEEALGKEEVVDADFWLLAAANELGYSVLLRREVLPSPSHLLSQLREGPKALSKGFEVVSVGARLEAAGRAGCGARLEGLVVLHDLLREEPRAETAGSEWSAARTEIIAAKADELVSRIELAECYSFLGQELVGGILSLLRAHPKRNLTDLTTGRDRLLGERLVLQLGLSRGRKEVGAGLGLVKGQVSALSKS